MNPSIRPDFPRPKWPVLGLPSIGKKGLGSFFTVLELP